MSEETEVKSTEEIKPQETKSQEKKAPAKKKLEDGIKQKIKEAQNDPKVKAASKKFAEK